jgi:Protein of unknown function (DUF4087)
MAKQLIKCRLTMIICSLLLLALGSEYSKSIGKPSIESVETRCGWFSNPTPANASLYDREREWIIAVQGGYQTKGEWPPVFSSKQWIKTNGHYGYGCACLRLRVNRATDEVIEIESSQPRALSACRRDRALRKWGFK